MANRNHGKHNRKIALRVDFNAALEARVNSCKDLGFDGLELAIAETPNAKGVSALLAQDAPGRPPVIALAATCRTTDVNAEIPSVVTTLAAAAQIGASVLNLSLPPLSTPDAPHGFPRYQSAINFLHRLFDTTRFEAERSGVALAVEVASGGCFLSPVEMRELIDVTSSWAVGVCLDLARIETIGQSADWIKTLTHRVHAVRMTCDSTRDGVFLRLAAALDETDFDRTVCVTCDAGPAQTVEILKAAGLLAQSD